MAQVTARPRPVMLIVGGTGSIGSEIARQAAQAGWAVLVHGRSKPRVDAVVAQTHAKGGFAADLQEPGAERALIARAGEVFGRLDAVVDCSTGGLPGVTGPFEDTDPAAFAALLDASAGRLQRLAHAALPWLEQSRGALIAFASDAGVFAAPGQSLIAASRAAIIGFVRNLAVEAARLGVRAHCICPSYVEGSASLARIEARSPARIRKARARAGLGLPTPADIAPAILFLCGPGAARLTGQIISVNGGINA